MSWKSLFKVLVLSLFVSIISSFSTWYLLSGKQEKQRSWIEILNLTPQQEVEFSKLESELNGVLKEVSLEDAQNKIYLCAHLAKEEMSAEDMKAATQKAVASYGQKQEKVASVLARISGSLTPEQKKKFTARLMHEICVSCRESMGNGKCLCGMCEHKT